MMEKKNGERSGRIKKEEEGGGERKKDYAVSREWR